MMLAIPSSVAATSALLKDLTSRRHGLVSALMPAQQVVDCGSRFSETLTGSVLQKLIAHQIGSHLPREDDLVIDECLSPSRAVPNAAPAGRSPRKQIEQAYSYNTRGQSPSAKAQADAANRTLQADAENGLERNNRSWPKVTPEPRSSFIERADVLPNGGKQQWSKNQTESAQARPLDYSNLLTKAIQRYWQRESSHPQSGTGTYPSTSPTSRVATDSAIVPSSTESANAFPDQIQQHFSSNAVRSFGAQVSQRPPETCWVRPNAPATQNPLGWNTGTQPAGTEDDLARQLADVLYKQAMLHGIDVT